MSGAAARLNSLSSVTPTISVADVKRLKEEAKARVAAGSLTAFAAKSSSSCEGEGEEKGKGNGKGKEKEKDPDDISAYLTLNSSSKGTGQVSAL